jgi:hypothetical protein
MMPTTPHTLRPDLSAPSGRRVPPATHAWRLLLAGTFAALLAVLVPATSQAKVTMVGSPLSTTATLNTAEDLGYPGTYTQVPVSPEAPNGLFHTFHFGADTAIWNFSKARGGAAVTATGQAKKIELEGCAQKAANGPMPLNEVHFQDLSPLPGGGVKVNLTSQGFDVPICGENGASGSTISSYLPINLCVSAGDYVGFNDSGGYVPNIYRNGVPFQVLGTVSGSSTNSFIKDEGTGNGATLSPSVKSADDGFAVSRNEELLMRVTLATGKDATHICPGGKEGLPPRLAPIRVSPQTDGVNHNRVVAVAVFCRVNPCKGVATLSPAAKTSGYGDTAIYGRAGFSLPANKTVHLPIRVRSALVQEIRAKHGVSTTLSAVVNGATITQRVTVKIL